MPTGVKAKVLTELSHQELTLLLFALEGQAAISDSPPSCQEACPVVDSIEGLFGEQAIAPEKQLAKHLNNHLYQGLIESGMIDLMASVDSRNGAELSTANQVKLRQINERLRDWRCEIKLAQLDKQLLLESVSRLPRSVWLSMPRTMWRLRKKLKSR